MKELTDKLTLEPFKNQYYRDEMERVRQQGGKCGYERHMLRIWEECLEYSWWDDSIKQAIDNILTAHAKIVHFKLNKKRAEMTAALKQIKEKQKDESS